MWTDWSHHYTNFDVYATEQRKKLLWIESNPDNGIIEFWANYKGHTRKFFETSIIKKVGQKLDMSLTNRDNFHQPMMEAMGRFVKSIEE